MDALTRVLFLDDLGRPVEVEATTTDDGIATLAAASAPLGLLAGDVVATSPGDEVVRLFSHLLHRDGLAAVVRTDDEATANQAETILRSAGGQPTRAGNTLVARLSDQAVLPLVDRLATCDLALRVLDEEDLASYSPLAMEQLARAFRDRPRLLSPPADLWELTGDRPRLAFGEAPFVYRQVLVVGTLSALDHGAAEALDRLGTALKRGGGRWAGSENSPGPSWTEVTVEDGCSAAWAFMGGPGQDGHESPMTGVVWASAAADGGPNRLFVATEGLTHAEAGWEAPWRHFRGCLADRAVGIYA